MCHVVLKMATFPITLVNFFCPYSVTLSKIKYYVYECFFLSYINTIKMSRAARTKRLQSKIHYGLIAKPCGHTVLFLCSDV